MAAREWSYTGVFPAMSCPFRDDLGIDDDELRRYTAWLIGHEGISGLVTNGHTGEVNALTAAQRAEVTRIVADRAGDAVPVISGICCEGIAEACEHAHMAREAGATALLIMPPHMWLRFGMRTAHVIEYFAAIGEASGLDLVVHVYPAWTRTSYSDDVLDGLARLDRVKCFKVGTREMNKYARDIRTIRAADPEVSVLTCHDEYLLPTMVQGVDGALVGFASFVPEMIVELYRLVVEDRLHEAMAVQARIDPLKDAVYGGGEPTGDAHARMKMAMVLSGRLKSAVVQPPIRQPEGDDLETIRRALAGAGLLARDAAE